MKKILIIMVMSLAVTITTGQIYGQNNNTRMYRAKSGIVEYELKGKTTGTQKMYFDDHGRKEVSLTESSTKMLGMTTKEKTMSLRIDSVLYSINLEDMTGTRMVMPFDPFEMSDEEIEKWEETGKQLMEDMGFEKVGDGEILGKKCEIWEGMGSKLWIWEGMTLKSEVNIMGEWITEATRIEMNAKIAPDKFKIPDGVEIVDQEFDVDRDGDTDQADMDALDSVASQLGEELGRSLKELKGILGGKKKKK